MKKHIPLTFICVFALLVPSVSADIIWNGNADNDIFNVANWDLSGSSVTTLEPNVSIDDNVQIGPGPASNWPVIPDLPAQQRFQLADGKVLNVQGAGTTLTIAGNDGVGGAPGTADGPTVNVSDAAMFAPFFVVNDVQVNIDGTSEAVFGGGGNPINLSFVDLTPGAVLSFLNETPAAYVGEHLSKTTVLGAPAVEGTNVLVEPLGAGGSVVAVIPEPSSILLTLFGTLALLACRRK